MFFTLVYFASLLSSRMYSRQYFQQTGILRLSTLQIRSSGSPRAGADVRHFSFLRAEKRGQHGGARRHDKKEKLERDKAFKLNKEIVQLGRDQEWKRLLSLYQKQKENFNNINYATTMSQLAHSRSIRKDDPLLKAFLDDLSKQFDVHVFAWMDTQGMANIAHAIGKMHLSGNDSAIRIVRRLEDDHNAKLLFENGTPQEVANCVWACATLGIKSPNLFGELERSATWLVENGNSQAIANCVWACATLGIKSPNLFGELERNATWLVKNGTPQAIANCVWACATLEIESPKLLSEIEKNADWLLAKSESHGVSQLACAFQFLVASRLTSF